MKVFWRKFALITSITFLAESAAVIKQDFQLLKKLLQYKQSDTIHPDLAATLAVPVTTTELSAVVSQTRNLSIVDDFYNTVFTGNRDVDVKLRSAISNAVPHLRTLAANRTDKLSKQRALVQLAVELQPLIEPIVQSFPNLTATINRDRQMININRTARGGYGGGGWGWGGGGGGGWGGCCEQTKVFMLEKGWGGDDHDELLKYLVASKGGMGGNSDLSTLLPLLFGLIALLIMKLPT